MKCCIHRGVRTITIPRLRRPMKFYYTRRTFLNLNFHARESLKTQKSYPGGNVFGGCSQIFTFCEKCRFFRGPVNTLFFCGITRWLISSVRMLSWATASFQQVKTMAAVGKLFVLWPGPPFFCASILFCPNHWVYYTILAWLFTSEV